MLFSINQSVITVIKKFNHSKNCISLRLAGKKEGVRGRNFCLPATGFSCMPPRRPPAFGRRGENLHKNFFLLFFEIFFKICSNFVIKPQPVGKFRFFCRYIPRKMQAASQFLPRELKVRLREAQSPAY